MTAKQAARDMKKTRDFLKDTAKLIAIGEIQTPIDADQAAETMDAAARVCGAATIILTAYDQVLRRIVYDSCVSGPEGDERFVAGIPSAADAFRLIGIREDDPVPDDFLDYPGERS